VIFSFSVIVDLDVVVLVRLDGIRKRSWLQMLNPLDRHPSPEVNEPDQGETDDLECPRPTLLEPEGYTGK
jgi:hypothetical protein